MPSSSINHPAAHGAPLWDAAVRAPYKENTFAPAMVPQEERLWTRSARGGAPSGETTRT